MGLIVKFEISCDLCWHTIIYSGKGMFSDENGTELPEGWGQPYPSDDDYILCPDCFKKHNELFPK